MSPTVFSINGRRYFFFSREESRMHVHVESGNGEAKFWLKPVSLAKSSGYSNREISENKETIESRLEEIIARWKEHFGKG